MFSEENDDIALYLLTQLVAFKHIFIHTALLFTEMKVYQ